MEDRANRRRPKEFPSPIMKTKVNWDEDLIHFTSPDSAQEDQTRRLSLLSTEPQHSSTPFRLKDPSCMQTPGPRSADDTIENIFYTPMCPQTDKVRGSKDETKAADFKNSREPHHCKKGQDDNQPISESLDEFDIVSRNVRRKSNTLAKDQNKEDSVGKFIGEEDLVDCVFHICDIEKAGRVPVSRIIDYLRHTATNPVTPNESMEKLDGLSSLLDPKGEDALVDLETYQTHMKNWIEDIRKYDLMQKRTRSNRLSSTDHSDYDLLNASYTTIGSLEGCGGEASFNLDAAELMTSVVELQKSSKKLNEQNQKLRQQVDSADEANTLLSLENDNLKKQLKSMQQQTTSRHNQLVDEIEELKGALAAAEKDIRRGEHRRGQLEKEGQNLQAQVDGLQDQLHKAAQEVETLQQENKNLVVTVRLQKECCGELEATTLAQQAQLDEHHEKQREMGVLEQEYSCTIQALRAEKHQLEEQLLQVQQDLARYRVERRMQLDVDDLDPTGVAVSPLSALHHSLHAELLDASGILPSPFCGNNSYKVQEEEETDTPCEDNEAQEGSSTGGLSTFSLEHFKLIAAQLISQFTNHMQRNNDTKQELSTHQKTRHPSELYDEMHSFQDKIDWLTQAKRAADRRVGQLTGTVSRLRLEREDLVREHQQQMQQVLEQVSMGKKNSQLLELVATIQSRTLQVYDLQKQVTALEDQLTESTNEVHTLAAALRLEMEARSRVDASLEDMVRKAGEAEDCLQNLQLELEEKKQAGDVRTKDTLGETTPRDTAERTTPVREPESLLKLRPCKLFSEWPPVTPVPSLRTRHLSTSCLDLAFTSSMFDKLASTVGTQTDLPRSPDSQLQTASPGATTSVKLYVENSVQTLPSLVCTADNDTQTEQMTPARMCAEVQTDIKTSAAETTQTENVEEVESATQTVAVDTCNACVNTFKTTEDQISQTNISLPPFKEDSCISDPFESLQKGKSTDIPSRRRMPPMLSVLRAVMYILAIVSFVLIIMTLRQPMGHAETWSFLEDVLTPHITLRHTSRPPF